MSAAADYDTDAEWQKLVITWQAAGHEVIHERGTFRHKTYRKDFPPETVIRKRDGMPYLTNHKDENGELHTLLTGEVLPERADMCLDEKGRMIDQHEFEKRYINDFLSWFKWVEQSEIEAEPIPNAERWICMIPDPFSESPGMVEVGFDAHRPADMERTHKYDPQRDELVEIMKVDREAQTITLKAVQQLLETQAAKDDARKVEPQKRGPGRPRKEGS